MAILYKNITIHSRNNKEHRNIRIFQDEVDADGFYSVELNFVIKLPNLCLADKKFTAISITIFLKRNLKKNCHFAEGQKTTK